MTAIKSLALRVCALAVLFGASLPAFSKTTITFEDRAVVAHVTPGASTAWYSVIHRWTGYRQKISRRASILVDGDGDGIVRMALSEPLYRSVFVVVDLSNGDRAVEAPPGIKFRHKPLPPSAFRSRGGSEAARILHGPETWMVFWIIRPGVGAWVATVDDGSPADGDASTDGNVSALLEKMRPVGQSPPAPDDFRRDDIVVAIAPETLDVFDGRFVN